VRAIPPTTKTKQFPIDATNLEHPGDFGVVFGIEALPDVLCTFMAKDAAATKNGAGKQGNGRLQVGYGPPTLDFKS
jgi:hypothetical protein